MRNTYFIEPDFRGASQFFTLDVTNAHWVRPKLKVGAQLCGLSVLDMNKLEEPEFYDHQDKLIKGAYMDTDGLVKYDSTIKNTWDNARRGVDVKGAFKNYNALYCISANNSMLTNLRNGALEKMGHLLP